MKKGGGPKRSNFIPVGCPKDTLSPQLPHTFLFASLCLPSQDDMVVNVKSLAELDTQLNVEVRAILCLVDQAAWEFKGKGGGRYMGRNTWPWVPPTSGPPPPTLWPPHSLESPPCHYAASQLQPKFPLPLPSSPLPHLILRHIVHASRPT